MVSDTVEDIPGSNIGIRTIAYERGSGKTRAGFALDFVVNGEHVDATREAARYEATSVRELRGRTAVLVQPTPPGRRGQLFMEWNETPDLKVIVTYIGPITAEATRELVALSEGVTQ